jgi:hypothetical protein
VFWARLSESTSRATSSVISASSSLRPARSSSPAATNRSSMILMLTSWSEQSTPAELSIASVLIFLPLLANSMRPRCVAPRLPPSATTRTRNRPPSTRIASLALSPTSAWDSLVAFT